MITLSHANGSRSCRVRWLLEELGLDYRLEAFEFGAGAMQAPEYLAKNPLGKVPTLEDDGLVLYESGAIVEYLLETYGGGRLAPPLGSPDRPRFLQWLHWSEATLLPPLGDLLAHRFVLPEDERVPAVADRARGLFHKRLRVLDDALAGREYLIGGALTAADIMMVYGPFLAKMVGELPDDFSNVVAYLDRLGARPAYQKAFGS